MAESSCGVGGGVSFGGSRSANSGVFGEDFVQRRDGGVHMFALQNVRRQETQHRVAGAVDENVPLEHLSDDELGEISRVQLGGNHQAAAAHIHDCIVAGGGGAPLGLEGIPRFRLSAQ